MPNPALESGALTQDGSVSEEVEILKRLLAERGQAALRATLDELDLRQRLDEAEEKIAELQNQLRMRSPGTADPSPVPAGRLMEPSDPVTASDVARLKADWRRGMKLLEQENRDRRSELVLVRSQLSQTQRQLELESTARQGESARSSTSIANLETELEEARHAATSSHRTQSRRQTTRGRIEVIVTMAGAVALAVAMWTIFMRPPSALRAAPATEVIAEPSLPAISPANHSAPRSDAASEPSLAGGMSRLNAALASFSNRRPEDILREIHRKAGKTDRSLCAFDWNNGQPSILYGGGGNLSLAASVVRCAAAIEKYH